MVVIIGAFKCKPAGANLYYVKRSRQNISRIENQSRKIDFFLFCQNISFCELVSKKIF